jgi:hypothetical protein
MTKKTKKFIEVNNFVWKNKGKSEVLETPNNFVSIAPDNGIVVKDSPYMRDMVLGKEGKNHK